MKPSHQEECILCCREIKIYATGACDHPVCYECSTRMRVLCETNECPVCRSDMPVVIFTKERQIFTDVSQKFNLCIKKYQIVFEDESVADAFDALLENRCKHCDQVFPTFEKLKEHVRRKHELHYCELCTDNLKIFTFERKCYTRKDLARHKRVGDPDETSHRGHPLCEHCDQRYMDRDELFRHVRKEHFFCHFCDADGLHQYYSDYEYLRNHFRKEHYLCEEGNCINERFTSAFRTDIDLKAHIAVHHSKNKSKAEAKQARVLDFEFAYPNRPSGSSSPRGGRYAQRRRNAEENNSQNRNRAAPPEPENLDTQSVQEFPYLSEDNVSKTAHGARSADTMMNSLSLQSFNRNPPVQQRKNVMSVEDFPALSSTAPPVSSSSDSLSKKISASFMRPSNSQVRTSNLTNQSAQRNVPTQNIGVSSSVSKSKRTDLEDGDRAQQRSQWTSKKNDFNFEEEFPTLEVKKNPPPFVPKVSSSVVSFATNNTSKQHWPGLSASSSMTNSVSKQKPPDPATSKISNSAAEPNLNDQFVVIKTKSKKKKQGKIYSPSDIDAAEDSSKQFVSKISVIENDKENKDLLKRYSMQPSLSTKPGNAKFSDTWSDERVSFGNEDFPPLAPTQEPAKKPPGFNAPRSRAPPPGFTANSTITTSSIGNKTLSDAVREIVMPDKVNGVKKSSNENTYGKYREPQNFHFRNDELIKRIYDLSNAQAILFQEFKSVSGKFRCGDISADGYHTKCLDILGEKGVIEIFPELVTLLPDIKKQQELLTVHNRFLSQLNRGATSKKSSTKSCSTLVSCEKCNQVLDFNDCKNHELLHNRENSQ
ncbi:E3 ubiquitin-protein ligase ZNF598 [Araneus ventricosus]|uniref:RING-type E3 ubiquitin transferase n=1 Tax=Araneus ventricosus TaxID=182803 RepID=A0A4Y2D4X1_ARAVE|nr:E3 ubiquitin-protein ligase ZNF598 [Araneus ventricosus]